MLTAEGSNADAAFIHLEVDILDRYMVRSVSAIFHLKGVDG